MAIMHTFTSPIADGTNTSLVRPSDWNAAHIGGIEAVGLSASTTNVATMGSVYWSGNNITIGLTTNANSSHSIVLSGNAAGGEATLSNYVFPQNVWHGNIVTSLSTAVSTNVTIRAIKVLQPIAFSKIEWPVSIAVAAVTTTGSSSQSWSHSVVVYSLNGAILSPVVGGTTASTTTVSTTATGSLAGPRLFSVPANTTLTPRDYWVGIQAQTGGNQANTLNHIIVSAGSQIANLLLPGQSVTTANFASTGPFAGFPLQGIIAASMSNTSNTWNISQISVAPASYYRANMIFQFKNVTY